MATATRVPIALRAAISTAVPVLIGWAAGDIGAGLMGTIGAFASRFGADRPYVNRGLQLAVVTVSLAVAITLGAWAAAVPWAGVLAVAPSPGWCPAPVVERAVQLSTPRATAPQTLIDPPAFVAAELSTLYGSLAVESG
jgi:hypothetical protein